MCIRDRRGIVDDVDTPDLVAELLDADGDAVGLDGRGGTLDERVETHAFGAQHEGEDLDGVEVMEGGDQEGGEDSE